MLGLFSTSGRLKGRTVVDSSTSFAGDIESAAKIGVAKVVMQPSALSASVATGLMRVCVVDASSYALNPEDIGHGIAGFDYLQLTGDKDIGQSFVHEAKLKSTHTGDIGEIAFYKASIDTVQGDFNRVYGFDFPDMSGIAGTVTTKAAINVRDSEATAILSGGYRTNINNVGVAAYTVKETDSGKLQGVLAGTPVTITLPHYIPGGCVFSFTQMDANQVTFASDGSSVLVNASGHTKTRTAYSVVQIRTITTGVYILSGDTAA